MAVRRYPVCQPEVICEEYEVKVNGVSAALNTARVSAMPFNRRWPGHQRSEDQTELINFLSMAMDEPVTFEIIPKRAFEKVEIRPKSLGVEPQVTKDGRIVFTLSKPAYLTVEPFGRQGALHIFADAPADYAVDPEDPDVIYFGPGEHEAGEVVLKSNQTLFLEEGAVVYATVRAMDAENIRILGRGILDNSHNKEQILFAYNARENDTAIKNAVRKHTVQLEYCTNVEIDGITMRDSLVYNIRPIGCRKMHIANVKIIGCWRYNSDGIDMHNCEDVLVEHCFLRTFDDSICVKGFDCYYQGDVEKAVREAMYRNGEAYEVFRNTLIRDCTIWNDWGKCLEIGAETKAEEICDIIFEDCDIIHVTSSVLDSYNIDYADVHDVIYRNIRVEYDDEILKPLLQTSDEARYENTDPDFAPYLIDVMTSYHPEYSVGSTRRGKTHDVIFENIRLYGRQKPRLRFGGYDAEHMTRDILVKNLYWNDELVRTQEETELLVEEFADNIRWEAEETVKDSKYAQMEKNSVDSRNQLKPTQYVRFENPEGTGIRVMFLGNSITLHGIRPEIGWNQEWGMAASAKEKDYVHRLIAGVRQSQPDAAFCICQGAVWEREYKNGASVYPDYESARAFGADVIVMRLIENCSSKEFEPDTFRKSLADYLAFLNPAGRAKVIFTTGFWRHPGDEEIIRLAEEMQMPLVSLGDLGELDEMKAIGRFAHTGVANHPGDLGMEKIAERISEELKKYL